MIDVVERAVEGIRIGRRSGAQLLGVPDEGFDELIVDGLVNDHASGRGAILAAVEERCLGDAGGGLLDVDVAEDDRRRFAAQFEVRALELLCCGHGDSDAARTEPVIETRPRAGFSTNVAPVPPLPSTTLNTPSGRMPFESFARTSVLPGVVSLA